MRARVLRERKRASVWVRERASPRDVRARARERGSEGARERGSERASPRDVLSRTHSVTRARPHPAGASALSTRSATRSLSACACVTSLGSQPLCVRA